MLKDVFKLARCAISFLRLRQNYTDIQKCKFLLINIVRGLFITKSLYKHVIIQLEERNLTVHTTGAGAIQESRTYWNKRTVSIWYQKSKIIIYFTEIKPRLQ